ncbi:hypothetical protein D3C76_1158400 [compost metagenome]
MRLKVSSLTRENSWVAVAILRCSSALLTCKRVCSSSRKRSATCCRWIILSLRRTMKNSKVSIDKVAAPTTTQTCWRTRLISRFRPSAFS